MAATHVGRVRGVGHDVEALLVDPPHDDVVDDEAVLVEQVGVLGPTGVDPPQVVAQRSLQVLEGVGPDDPHGAQMADVERHRRLATRPVLRHGARRVRERHLPAAEGHQLRAERHVRVVQG